MRCPHVLIVVAAWTAQAACQRAAAPPPGPLVSATASGSASSVPAPRAAAGPLVAELRIKLATVPRVQDLRVTLTLHNSGTDPVRVRTLYVGSVLSFEVRDAAGRIVPPGPPPTPVVDDGISGWQTIAPGGVLAFEANAGIQSDVPQGRYEIRFRGVPDDPVSAELATPWVPFDVSPAQAKAPCPSCLASHIAWSVGGGLGRGVAYTLTPCNTYASRTFNTSRPDACSGTVSCDPGQGGSTVAITRILSDPDVKAALARPSTRFGWRSPAFEGGDFQLTVDGASISVAADCEGRKPCIEVPRGLRRAVEYLERGSVEQGIADLTCGGDAL